MIRLYQAGGEAGWRWSGVLACDGCGAELTEVDPAIIAGTRESMRVQTGSLGGAFVALLVTHSAFSMPSLIGLIMLMGIATKNSILLVEYALVEMEKGASRWEALVDACSKRARPRRPRARPRASFCPR